MFAVSTTVTLRAKARSKGIVEVFQFKATVWPKIASESTYEAQKFQNFLGEHPPDPPAFRTASGLIKAGRGVGMMVSTHKRSVPKLCPGIGFVLATPLPNGMKAVYTSWPNKQPVGP